MAVMGDHDHRHAFLIQCGKQIHNLGAGLGIQCSGGRVRQQDGGIVHQSAGIGHPLQLTAGHLAGMLVQLVAQTHFLQCLGGAAAALGAV